MIINTSHRVLPQSRCMREQVLFRINVSTRHCANMLISHIKQCAEGGFFEKFNRILRTLMRHREKMKMCKELQDY